jgi:AraC family transcriptional regulator, regulatory protein of adaptative response / methylated-DNA-[protein]-cysteine methyltransferase
MPKPAPVAVPERDFARIAAAIRFLAAQRAQQPSLAEVARHAGLSAFHFNRLFRRWAGVTPKQYLEVLAAHTAEAALRRGDSVLDAALATGLSGPGRLHDLLVTLEAATPGVIRRAGEGLEIRWGIATSPFGALSVGATDRGLCHLAFGTIAGQRDAPPARLAERWPRASYLRDDTVAGRVATQLAAAATGIATGQPLRLYVAGTNFQLRVWRALLELGTQTTTYGALAATIAAPGAARAVGGAVGANPIAWLIPCHRVLRENGALGGYAWGEDRKRAILAWESLQARSDLRA